MKDLGDLFYVICADPPWQADDQPPKAGAAHKYKTMPLEEICRFELPPTAPDAWLFMWRVHWMAREAFDVFDAWEFEYVTEIVWDKLTTHGLPFFGAGHHFRGSHEVCMVGRRGKPKRAARAIRSRFEAPVGEHSEKPEFFYRNIVEPFTGHGPYCELFGRRLRYGWTVLGNEVPNDQIDAHREKGNVRLLRSPAARVL